MSNESFEMIVKWAHLLRNFTRADANDAAIPIFRHRQVRRPETFLMRFTSRTIRWLHCAKYCRVAQDDLFRTMDLSVYGTGCLHAWGPHGGTRNVQHCNRGFYMLWLGFHCFSGRIGSQMDPGCCSDRHSGHGGSAIASDAKVI